MLRVRLEGAGTHPIGVAVGSPEATQVHHPQVVGRSAVVHPFGQSLSGATTGGYPEGVETGANEKVLQLRRLAEDEVAVGSEALRPVDELAHPSVGEGRHAPDGEFHRWGEVVPVAVEQLEVERAGDASSGPGDRVRLVAAHHQATDLLLVVGEPVRVA